MYVLISAIYYEIGITTVNDERDNVSKMNKLRSDLLVSNDEQKILSMLNEVKETYKILGPKSDTLY